MRRSRVSRAPASRSATLALFAALVLVAPLSAQSKPRVMPEDYRKWESLSSATWSDDGRWFVAQVNRVDMDGEIQLIPARGGDPVVLERGQNASFSADGRWLAYTIAVPQKEAEKLQDQNKPVRNQLGIRNLETGEETVVPDISSFSFSGSGTFIAMRGYRPEGAKGRGVAVVVRDLERGTDTHFGNIAEVAWQDEGALLAMVIDAETKIGNGVQLFDPTSGVTRSLDTDTVAYKGLQWRDESGDLAAMKVRTSAQYEDTSHVVLAWTALHTSNSRAHVLDPADQAGFPTDTRIVDYRDLEWADDGSTVFLGIKEWERKEQEADSAQEGQAPGDSARARADSTAGNDDEKPGVEVWHAKDVEIIPEQKVRAEREKRRNQLAAWHVADDRFVALDPERMFENVQLFEGQKRALGADETPYDIERMFGPSYSDLYVVDVNTGAAQRVKEQVQFSFGPSPGGRYLLYLENDHYWVYDIQNGTHTNITETAPVSFIDHEDDHTVQQKPPFGVGRWTPGDRSVLLYDKYDIWEVTPDGRRHTKLTDGTAEEVRHRLVWLDPEERVADLSKPVYVALYGERTKKFGYGRIRDGRTERLLFEDRNIGRLVKAEDAESYAWISQGFDDSPDWFLAGPTLADGRQVTNTNAFQSSYAWGRSELLDYENRQGVPLQAALYYPANYEPGRKYPMLVYYYEITSNTLHSYSVPNERQYYNPQVWSQEGYFVLRPDIVYRDRNPGLSAVDALVPAVERALATDMIDPERIGLIGHSWGGYQTAFVPTQTDIFAAAVAGAPLTELYSMYLSIYWNTGGTDARIFEISQGRMEVPPWQDLDSYLANSPIHHIESLNTPMMIMFGTEDGAVDWDQGTMMYNAARRAGKDFVMLVYEGENHGLAKKPNQIDYHRRILEWFGHHLKDEPAADWIINGVRFLERDREKRPNRITAEQVSSNGRN